MIHSDASTNQFYRWRCHSCVDFDVRSLRCICQNLNSQQIKQFPSNRLRYSGTWYCFRYCSRLIEAVVWKTNNRQRTMINLTRMYTSIGPPAQKSTAWRWLSDFDRANDLSPSMRTDSRLNWIRVDIETAAMRCLPLQVTISSAQPCACVRMMFAHLTHLTLVSTAWYHDWRTTCTPAPYTRLCLLCGSRSQSWVVVSAITRSLLWSAVALFIMLLRLLREKTAR